MGVCMAPEVRRELKQIEEIYHKTCELKQSKRVLVVGATGSGKSELIEQAISTNNSYPLNDEYLDFQYHMGPFTVCEKAQAEHSLQAWRYKHDIISWDNTLSYYPPIYSEPSETFSSESIASNPAANQFDFDLLFRAYTRSHGDIVFTPKIRDVIDSYYPRPSIQCSKDEIINETMVEFWELSSFDHAFWTFCVKQIVAIAFVVDLSCFDEFHYDPLTYTKTNNKLSETMDKFRDMVQDKAVKECNNIAFFVIFNKIDVFKQKLSSGTSIKTCREFSGYTADNYDYTQCIAYIKEIFDDVNDSSDRLLYFHETCGVYKDGSDLNLLGTIDEDSSSDNIKKVWNKFGANLNYHWNLLRDE